MFPRKGWKVRVASAFVTFFLIFGVVCFMEPEVEVNPRFPLETISGRWKRDDQILELTITERHPSRYDGSGKYVLKTGSYSQWGTWTLNDWNLKMSEIGLMRIVKVGSEFQIIKGHRGGELRFDENFTRL